MGGDFAATPTTSLLADQRSHWDRGVRVHVEDYLKRRPELRDNTEILLDLIYAEVVLRREVGEQPTADEYVARFPALADPIRTQFEVDVAIDSALTQTGSGTADEYREFPTSPAGFEILEELGRGGMGVVYKARHRMLDRLVALKMIRSGEFADPAEKARFEAEARAVARLSHPNIIQIHEVGEINGVPFLVLEFIDGLSLAEVLRGDPIRPRPAAKLMATLAHAMQHAHDAGIVHRDLKPANVLLAGAQSPAPADEIDSNPTFRIPAEVFRIVKITDFGLAKRMGADGPTKAGDFLGTPNFAAPEQAAGREDVGALADVYSLGAILYHMLTGRPPFAGATPLETLDQVRFSEPVPPSRLRPNLPRDLETIALKCLRKEPSRRYRSAAALADDLDRFLNGRAIHARPVGSIERVVKWCRRRPAVAGMLALVLLLASASLLTTTWLWRQAATARDAEGRARDDERLRREQLEARSADLLIANALYAWLTDDIDAARRTLAECPFEHRNADWNQLTRACAASRMLVPPGSFPIECIAVSGDGAMVAGATSSSRVFVWDAKTGRELLNVNLPSRAPMALAFTDDGRLAALMNVLGVATGTDRDLIEMMLIDLASARVTTAWARPDRPMRMLIAPGGRRVVSLQDKSNAAELLDARTGKSLHTLQCRGMMRNLAFSSDGKFVVASALPQELRVWEVASGAPAHDFGSRETFFGMNSLATSADGRTVVFSYTTPKRGTDVILLGVDAEVRRMHALNPVINEVVFSRDGRLLAARGASNSVIQVWDANTGREEMILRGHPTTVRSMTFRTDSKQLIAGYADGRVVAWNLD